VPNAMRETLSLLRPNVVVFICSSIASPRGAVATAPGNHRLRRAGIASYQLAARIVVRRKVEVNRNALNIFRM
jgi:hypothetical protein